MGKDNTEEIKPNKPENIGEPNRQPDGTFGPGNVANPKGRPKRKTLTELVHAKLDDTPEAWEAVVALVIQKLLKDKDNNILKTFWEYTDGKPKQTVEIDSPEERWKKYYDELKRVQDTHKDVPSK